MRLRRISQKPQITISAGARSQEGLPQIGMKILTWMWDNRQWLFSGAGFIVAAGFFRFLVSLSNRKRKIEVVLSHGFPTYSDHAGPVSLIVEAKNPGTECVTLNAFGLRLPDGGQIVSPSADGTVRLPHDLYPGKNCIMWIEIKPVAESFAEQGLRKKIKLSGFYRDALGREYKSNSLDFDPPAWLRVTPQI